MQGLSLSKVVGTIIVIVALGLIILGIDNSFENLDAEHIMVIQSPLSGELTWHMNAGVKQQWFGKVTKYKKRSQFWFSMKGDQGKDGDESIPIRFNDGGHANISGSIAWEMPIDKENLTALHTKYGSQEAIDQQLIRTIIEKSVYMTGPLMSSKESYAERRNELLQYIEDQVQNGVYLTQTVATKIDDPMTGKPKTVNVVNIVMKNGIPSRADMSPLKEFGIKTFNLSINKIPYDQTVEGQIKSQQEMTMSVQTAVAEAKKSEQAAITAEKNGQAEAAKAKWDQEVLKAKAVTEAQQKLEVARLEALAAAQNKRKSILEGEGEAEKRKLIMRADGGLELKLATYEKVNQMYATAMEKYTGDWVPKIYTGAGGGGANNAANQLITLLSAKTAKDLGLDMSMTGRAQTANPNGGQ